MKTPPRHSSAWFQNKLAIDIIEITRASKHSGSQAERGFWLTRLTSLLVHALDNDQEKLLIDVLEHLLEHDIDSYVILIDELEHVCEQLVILDPHTGTEYQALLLLIPVAACSRYSIPYGSLTPNNSARLRRFLVEHMLALDTQLELVPHILTEEQMPQSYSATRSLLVQLSNKALGKGALSTPLNENIDDSLLADTRYFIASVLAPANKPIFKWQEQAPSENQANDFQKTWQEKTKDFFQQLFPVAQLSVLKPNSFYHNYREIDKLLRPLSVSAGITWVTDNFKVNPSAIEAVIACCTDGSSEQFRIGFNLNKQVVYGSVWPAFDEQEAENQHINLTQIKKVLAALGIEKIITLPGLYQVNMYDDTEQGYFPTTGGDLVQPDIPSHINIMPVKLH